MNSCRCSVGHCSNALNAIANNTFRTIKTCKADNMLQHVCKPPSANREFYAIWTTNGCNVEFSRIMWNQVLLLRWSGHSHHPTIVLCLHCSIAPAGATCGCNIYRYCSKRFCLLAMSPSALKPQTTKACDQGTTEMFKGYTREQNSHTTVSLRNQ